MAAKRKDLRTVLFGNGFKVAAWALIPSILLYFVRGWHEQKWDFAKFLEGPYGIGVGLLISVVIGIMVTFIPNDVQTIVEALSKPLTGIQEIKDEALSMLERAGTAPESRFWMIAAAPVFGIELPDKDVQEWRDLVEARIRNGLNVEFLCWKWESPGGVKDSHLGKFCKQLQSYLQTMRYAQASEPGAYIRRTWQMVDEMLALARGGRRDQFFLGLVGEPPIGLVYSSDGHKERALFYFVTEFSMESKMEVLGFSTENRTWVQMAEQAFKKLKSEVQPLVDNRTPDERDRDRNLFTKYEDTTKDAARRECKIGDLTVHIAPEVFPSDSGLAVKALLEAIKSADAKVFGRMTRDQKLGIDVGTGCGILALALARFCGQVYATDNFEPAYENARETAKAAAGAVPQLGKIDVFFCDLIDKVPAPQKQRQLMVFNHPLYPSPFNVYNTGGPTGGNQIVERFLKQANARMEPGDAIIMPYSSVSANHDPEVVAMKMDFVSETLRSLSGDDNVVNKVYLFTKKASLPAPVPTPTVPVPTPAVPKTPPAAASPDTGAEARARSPAEGDGTA